VIEALLDLPVHLRDRLASALETGLIDPSSSRTALQSVLGSMQAAEIATPGVRELGRLAVSGPASAAWIRSLSTAATRSPPPDLVWSGPKVRGIHARDTRQVYDELIGAAERSLWISTYAFFDGPRAFEHLARRMDATPGLSVTLLLNIQRRRGDTTSADELVRRFADRFWTVEWPGSTRPRLFYDPRALDADGPAGVLHAKAVVSDEEAVFVTSANLTEAALDRNIELGLLVRDRSLAISVSSHFRGLVESRLLRALPLA